MTCRRCRRRILLSWSLPALQRCSAVRIAVLLERSLNAVVPWQPRHAAWRYSAFTVAPGVSSDACLSWASVLLQSVTRIDCGDHCEPPPLSRGFSPLQRFRSWMRCSVVPGRDCRLRRFDALDGERNPQSISHLHEKLALGVHPSKLFPLTWPNSFSRIGREPYPERTYRNVPDLCPPTVAEGGIRRIKSRQVTTDSVSGLCSL